MTTTPVTTAPLRGRNGMAALASWNQLEPVVPDIVATMRRYLEQIRCVLRPGSVVNADIALRSFAGKLAPPLQQHREQPIHLFDIGLIVQQAGDL